MLKHSDPAAQITTRGGIPLEVRPARHDDRGAILELLKAASPDDLRLPLPRGGQTVRYPRPRACRRRPLLEGRFDRIRRA